MAKTTTTGTHYNPFSTTLMSYINGVVSKNQNTAQQSFKLLINYFETNQTTEAELNCLIMTNANYVIYLLDTLRSSPKAHELLRSTVGKVVAAGLEASSEELFDFTDESEDDTELAGAADPIEDSAAE